MAVALFSRSFSENSALRYDLYSRADYNGGRKVYILRLKVHFVLILDILMILKIELEIICLKSKQMSLIQPSFF